MNAGERVTARLEGARDLEQRLERVRDLRGCAEPLRALAKDIAGLIAVGLRIEVSALASITDGEAHLEDQLELGVALHDVAEHGAEFFRVTLGERDLDVLDLSEALGLFEPGDKQRSDVFAAALGAHGTGAVRVGDASGRELDVNAVRFWPRALTLGAQDAPGAPRALDRASFKVGLTPAVGLWGDLVADISIGQSCHALLTRPSCWKKQCASMAPVSHIILSAVATRPNPRPAKR